MYVVGEPVSIVKLFTFKGINPETGIYEFVDEDGDGGSGAADKKYIHNFGRKYYGGLNNTISFKSFELSFLFQYVDQTSLRYAQGVPGQMVNQPAYILDRWRRPGDEAQYQKYTSRGVGLPALAFSDFLSSDVLIENSSFLRLKTLTLGYTLPNEMLEKTKLGMAKIYLQGQNLLTVTDYTGLDPETGSALPPLRMITLGVQIKI
jgi:TonB-dependent starch-binding outer membrane protein SusC